MTEEGRRRHYGAFYGLEELPTGDRPRVYVHGNCQAEALRISLSTADAVDSVRVPPVHELTEDDLPHLERLLAWADVLAAQQVSAGYRGLPLGTAEVLSRMAPGARLVRLPNYFSTVLYPEQVLVRHEDPGVVDPPVVPYHDVRRLGLAAGWRAPDRGPADARQGLADRSGGLTAGAVSDNAARSLAELERREEAQGSLRISDVVRSAGAEAGWTVDHPGNPVLLALAQRVLHAVAAEEGLGGSGAARVTATAQVSDPGRVLLGSVRTPLRIEVLDALGLDGEPREGWLVDGREVSDEEIGEAHLAFYADHPHVVEVGISKKGDALRRIGWTP